MSTIVARAGKGSPLTNAEIDANFNNLNTDKWELGGTYAAGAANGVPYLNATKVLTTDATKLAFDGVSLDAAASGSFGVGGVNANNYLLRVRAGTSGLSRLIAADTADAGYIDYDHSVDAWIHRVAGAETMRLTATGLGVGTSAPAASLHVERGSAGISGLLRNTLSTSYTSLRLYNDVNSSARALEIDYSGSAFGASALLAGGPAGEAAAITTTGAFPLLFGTNNAYRAMIDTSGNLLLGSTTTDGFDGTSGLKVSRASFPAIVLEQTSGIARQWLTYVDSAGAWRLFDATSDLTRVAVDTNGKVLIGASAADGESGNTGLTIRTANAASTTGNTNALRLAMTGNSGNVVGTMGATLEFAQQYDSVDTALIRVGSIKGYKDAGSGSFGGGLAFFTQPVGAGASLERMRIDSSGNLLVGRTDAGLTNSNGVTISAANAQIENASEALFLNRTGTDGGVAQFRRQNAVVGSISVTASATTYNTSSDRRLKSNILPAPNAGADIDAIQIVSHDWRADGSHVKFGVIAQDLYLTAPQAVSVGDDGETIERTWGVDYSKLVPMLVKEVQSLRARMSHLESQTLH